ncbi:MAG: MTH938/NDUFAF3 family protein [Haloechinothrix sp.]
MATIEDYRFGRIVIDGVEHRRDVIILPDRVVGNWWRKDGHGLVLDDLAEVLDDIPQRLLIGNGHDSQLRPDPDAVAALEQRGITVEVLPTRDAVGRYATLNPAGTAAALHLTC